MTYNMIFKYQIGTIKLEGCSVSLPNLAKDQEVFLAPCESFGPLKSILIVFKD